VHEKVRDGYVKMRFICSQDLLADTLISCARFQLLRSKLRVACPTVRLREHISSTDQDVDQYT
jgi:hypothetical protein